VISTLARNAEQALFLFPLGAPDDWRCSAHTMTPPAFRPAGFASVKVVSLGLEEPHRSRDDLARQFSGIFGMDMSGCFLRAPSLRPD
jgi:hypothetical protein